MGIRSLGGGRAIVLRRMTTSPNANDQIAVHRADRAHRRRCAHAEEILSVRGRGRLLHRPQRPVPARWASSPTWASPTPVTRKRCSEVLRAAKSVGTPAGIHTPNAEHGERRIAQGFQFIAIASDAGFMKTGAKQAQAAIKGWSPRA